MAIARVECCKNRGCLTQNDVLSRERRRRGLTASIEIEPYDMAPVTKRRTISLHGSTCSMGMGVLDSVSNSRRPRRVTFLTCSWALAE